MTYTKELISLTEVAKSLNKAPSTVWRWFRNGVKIRGQQIKLKAIQVGGNYFTNHDDLKQFLNDTNETSSKELRNETLKQTYLDNISCVLIDEIPELQMTKNTRDKISLAILTRIFETILRP